MDRPSSSPSQQPSDKEEVAERKPPSVTVVEDNSADVELLRYALEAAAIAADLHVLTDGDEAFRYLDDILLGKAACPVLFILDFNLPKKSGRDVLRRLRETQVCPGVPVVVFSSSAAEQDKQAAASLGANRYITKPSNLEDFLKVGEMLKPFIERK